MLWQDLIASAKSWAKLPKTKKTKTKRLCRRLQDSITFEDVHFEYEENTPVLRGISFDSEAGTTTALVGSSGSGKSTILSLVLNFIQPTSGKISVDGKDLQSLKLHDYRRYLGVVLQDDFLFDGTILENVRFSNPQASLAEIKEACRIAYCDEFIEKFEKGYDTIVGERGVKLSGGQRQRLAIARALLANPRILILDEATSSLDSESEQKIQEGLNTLEKVVRRSSSRIGFRRFAAQIKFWSSKPAKSSKAERTINFWK